MRPLDESGEQVLFIMTHPCTLAPSDGLAELLGSQPGSVWAALTK